MIIILNDSVVNRLYRFNLAGEIFYTLDKLFYIYLTSSSLKEIYFAINTSNFTFYS